MTNVIFYDIILILDEFGFCRRKERKMKKVLFSHNAEVADRLVIENPEVLTVEDFVKFNIYNTAKIQYNFAKYSPLRPEQKEELKKYLLNFKNGDIKGYGKNLEKWVKAAVAKGVI